MKKIALFCFSVLFLAANSALAGDVIAPGAIIGATKEDLKMCTSMFIHDDMKGLEKMVMRRRCGLVIDPIPVKLSKVGLAYCKVRVIGEGMEVWVPREFLK